MSLDDLVRRADPIRDEPLEFDDAFESLREAIVARPVVARTRPQRRRRWLVPPAVAAVASAVAPMVFIVPGDRGTERAWAAPLVKVAESVPRLLVGEWQVTRAEESGGSRRATRWSCAARRRPRPPPSCAPCPSTSGSARCRQASCAPSRATRWSTMRLDRDEDRR